MAWCCFTKHHHMCKWMAKHTKGSVTQSLLWGRTVFVCGRFITLGNRETGHSSWAHRSLGVKGVCVCIQGLGDFIWTAGMGYTGGSIMSSHHPSGIYQMRVITLWFYLLYHQTNLIYLLQPNKKSLVSTSGQTQWNGMFQVVFIAGPQIKMAREVFDFSGTTLICYSNLLIWACDCKKKTWNVTNKMSHNTNLVTAIRHSLTPTLAHVGWARLYWCLPLTLKS